MGEREYQPCVIMTLDTLPSGECSTAHPSREQYPLAKQSRGLGANSGR